MKQNNLLQLALSLSSKIALSQRTKGDCILAKILQKDGGNSAAYTRDEVEDLISEAQTRAIENAFGADPLARDMLFQKLRKLLHELLMNSSEHSAKHGDTVYAGVYARIRSSRPLVASEASHWIRLFNADLAAPGQANFKPNPYTEWVELYICDAGVGLLAHMSSWKAEGDERCAQILKNALESDNQLESIFSQLFNSPLSRKSRTNGLHTAVTGLQHLGHVLRIGGDYGRIYTQSGSWIGDHFPWSQPSGYSRKDEGKGRRTGVSGTAYHFSIQPNHHNLDEARSQWSQPNVDHRNEILKALRTRTIFDSSVGLVTFDGRRYESLEEGDTENLRKYPPDTVVLRPSKLFGKQQLAHWLVTFAGHRFSPPIVAVREFIIADITLFQMVTIRELLLGVEVYIDDILKITLVSEDWLVISLVSSIGNSTYFQDDRMAAEFFESSNKFWAGDLAVLLRQMDSETFWYSEGGTLRPHFLNEPVEWRPQGYKDDGITLNKYLDFSYAVSNPECFRACRRSLRRCLALFPEYAVKAADDLVDSLVREAHPRNVRMRENHDISAPTLIVGSVAVTAGTVNRTLAMSEREQMHILVHADAEIEEDDSPLSAILWIDHFEKVSEKSPSIEVGGRAKWRRIPQSPYIAPGGAKSVSVLRFDRDQAGNLVFEKPLYGRGPNDTYLDFHRLNVLKFGHWRYAKKHDLLTINMRAAFAYSFLELGPLHEWLVEKFKYLFTPQARSQPARSQLMIYPSHPVTDSMMNRLRQDKAFANILPRLGVFPVKAVTNRTVSPIITSQIAAHRIKTVVSENGLGNWSATIFDDAVVTGKTLRELQQFLLSLGAAKVYTIAILDRSGFPNQDSVLKSQLSKHPRFWRWDVPGLGNERDCPMCRAVSTAQIHMGNLTTERQRTRLRQWREIWRVRDVDKEWYRDGLAPASLDPAVKVAFGVNNNAEEIVRKNFVEVADSTTLSSVVSELTRLTTAVDLTIRKAEAMKRSSPEAALQLLVTQLILYQDELSESDQFRRYEMMLELMWEFPSQNDFSALAGMTFTLASNTVAERLWVNARLGLLRDRQLICLDAILAVSIIRARVQYSSHSRGDIPGPAGEVERKNFLLLGDLGEARETLKSFLYLYRNPVSSGVPIAHRMPLHAALHNIINSGDNRSDNKLDAVREIEALLSVLIRLQDDLYATLSSDLLEELHSLLETLKTCTDQASDGSMSRVAFKLVAVLFGTPKKKGLLNEAWEQYFVYIRSDEDFDNNGIGPILRRMRTNWQNYVISKCAVPSFRQFASVWVGQSRNVMFPSIRKSARSDCVESWVYFSSFVQCAVEDVMMNVFHAAGALPDPFDSDSGSSETLAHMWWRTTCTEEAICLCFANCSASKSISLKHTVNIAALEQIGGDVKVELRQASTDPASQFVAFTIISLPLHTSFI